MWETVIYLGKDRNAVGIYMFNTRFIKPEYMGNVETGQLVNYKAVVYTYVHSVLLGVFVRVPGVKSSGVSSCK